MRAKGEKKTCNPVNENFSYSAFCLLFHLKIEIIFHSTNIPNPFTNTDTRLLVPFETNGR